MFLILSSSQGAGAREQPTTNALFALLRTQFRYWLDFFSNVSVRTIRRFHLQNFQENFKTPKMEGGNIHADYVLHEIYASNTYIFHHLWSREHKFAWNGRIPLRTQNVYLGADNKLLENLSITGNTFNMHATLNQGFSTMAPWT